MVARRWEPMIAKILGGYFANALMMMARRAAIVILRRGVRYLRRKIRRLYRRGKSAGRRMALLERAIYRRRMAIDLIENSYGLLEVGADPSLVPLRHITLPCERRFVPR